MGKGYPRRPTVCNKPAGLVNNWPHILSKTGPATHCHVSPLSPSTLSLSSSTQALPATLTPLWQPQSMPSSSTQAFPTTSTTFWQPQPSLVMPNVDSFDHFMSLPDTIAPFLGQLSLPFHLNAVNNVPQQFLQLQSTPTSVVSLSPHDSRTHLTTQVPGLKDLPPSIQPNFHNAFIHHIMKLVFSATLPWSNPSLSAYQDKFNKVYSFLRYRLHGDDAVVMPVIIFND